MEGKDFIDWVDGRKSRLWCFGAAGTGKSVLAAAVVNHLESRFLSAQMVGLAYASCQYADRRMQTTEAILASLAHQLLEHCVHFQSGVLALHEKYLSKDLRPSRDELSDLLRELIAKQERTYLVLDGLDECEDQSIRDLLEDVLGLDGPVRILILSQDTPTLRSELGGAAIVKILAHERNLKRYVSTQIAGELRLRSLCEANPGLQSSIVDKIVKKSDGT